MSQTKKAVVAEENGVFQRELTSALREKGFEVITVPKDGGKLMEAAKLHLPDAIIAEAFMAVGYWLYEAVVIGEGIAAAFAGVSGNVFQGLAGIAGSYFLIGVLSHTGAVRAYVKGRAE